MKIITLTLNPAFDLHCFCKGFKPYHESIAEILSRDAGGKGVNISRGLLSSGCKNLALVLIGRENGEEFKRGLIKDGVDFTVVYTEGRIRENLTLHEDVNPETRISFEGFSAREEILDDIMGEFDKDLSDTVVTFTGSAPKGVSKEGIIGFLKELKSRGAKLVIDSRSLELCDIYEIKPWLIKPNKDEAEGYTKVSIDSAEQAERIAQDIYQKGVENVLLSIGEGGAVLACSEGVYYKRSPSVEVKSTIGAGDSMIAGFISGIAEGRKKEDCLRLAVAFGTSACMEEGTRPPQKEKVDELYKLIK